MAPVLSLNAILRRKIVRWCCMVVTARCGKWKYCTINCCNVLAPANLTPKDVVVMVADINRYGPYIQAVFGSAAAGEYYIPFSISTARQHRKIRYCKVSILLSLPSLRCTATELLELLAVLALLKRFGLAESDLTTLRRWALESGVRWGLALPMVSALSCHHASDIPGRSGWNGCCSVLPVVTKPCLPMSHRTRRLKAKCGETRSTGAVYQPGAGAARHSETARPITEWQNLVDRLLLDFTCRKSSSMKRMQQH